MRRFLSVVLIGIAVASSVSAASAQGRGRGQARARGGVVDTARARRADAIRAALADTSRRRARADSFRARRPDSLRANRTDSIRGDRPDSLRAGRGRGAARPGDVGGGRGALAGLDLSSTEKESVRAIGQKYAAELKEFRKTNASNAGGQNPELRAELQKLAERERAEIRSALSAENQAKFDANVAKGRGGRGRGKPPIR